MTETEAANFKDQLKVLCRLFERQTNSRIDSNFEENCKGGKLAWFTATVTLKIDK